LRAGEVIDLYAAIAHANHQALVAATGWGEHPIVPVWSARLLPEEPNMKDSVYKLIELTGTSTTSIEDAVAKAIKRAAMSPREMCITGR
jgi:hypothetical protein